MSPSRTKFFVEAIPLIEERPSGVAHALLGLVSALAADDAFLARYEIVLVVPKRALPRLDRWPALKHCSRKGLPLRLRILNGLMKFHLLPPMDILLGRGVYLFGNFKNWPVTKKSYSLTYIHDIAFALYPEFVSPKNQRMLIKNVPRFIAQTNAVITVSETAKREIVDYYHLDPDRVVVLYNGVDTTLYRPYPQADVEAVMKRYGVPGKYFLFLGSIEPRKNLTRLVQAFQALPKDYSLVLIGGSGWMNDDVLAAIDEARAQGASIIRPETYVSDEDCAKLLSGAVAFVHPALHEGFGLPPAEALAAQIPVLAADIPILHEVLGDSGTYFDPLDVTAISRAMQAAIAMSASSRKTSAKKGIIRVKKFAWGESARRLQHFIDNHFK